MHITTFGESHGKALGVVVDGCPAGISVDLAHMQSFLNRRRPGQSSLTSSRLELDKLEILSGIENSKTLGTPVAMLVYNRDQRPQDYEEMKELLRPSHADYTYLLKYGYKPKHGGGRASARETVARVAAGALASQLIRSVVPELQILSWVHSVQNISCNLSPEELTTLSFHAIENSPVRCPDVQKSLAMEELIKKTQDEGDTLGGTIATLIRNCPAGLGEPVFDKFEARLAQSMLSIPAAKGFEIGSGFEGTRLYGSQHNDPHVLKGGKIRTSSNYAGGVQGGISNGEDIYFRVAFKPVSTVFKQQKTVTLEGKAASYQPQKGRHDPCVLPRAVPIVESMSMLAVADYLLLRSRK